MSSAAPNGALDAALARRFGLVAGVDEVGRGSLAGPVVAAAVILGSSRAITGVDDSKRVSPVRRERLAPLIRERAVAWTLAMRDAGEIDRLNILRATVEAMKEAILLLDPAPGCVIVDALKLDGLEVPVVAEPRADGRYLCVAAASIVAKVARDRLMTELSHRFPAYGSGAEQGLPDTRAPRSIAAIGAVPIASPEF